LHRSVIQLQTACAANRPYLDGRAFKGSHQILELGPTAECYATGDDASLSGVSG